MDLDLHSCCGDALCHTPRHFGAEPLFGRDKTTSISFSIKVENQPHPTGRPPTKPWRRPWTDPLHPQPNKLRVPVDFPLSVRVCVPRTSHRGKVRPFLCQLSVSTSVQLITTEGVFTLREAVFTLGDASHFLTSASNLNSEPNGGIFYVSAKKRPRVVTQCENPLMRGHFLTSASKCRSNIGEFMQ